MNNLNSIDAIEDFIKDNKFVIVYFSSNDCNVCHNISPRIEEMLKKYSNVVLRKVDIEKLPSVASRYSVFTIPTVIMFFEAKEIIRQARYINFLELEEKIQRFSAFI